MESLEFLSRWADQHVAHEKSVVGASANDSDPDSVAFVPSRETIDNVYAITGVEVVNGTFAINTPDLLDARLSVGCFSKCNSGLINSANRA